MILKEQAGTGPRRGPLKFLEYARDIVFKLLSLSQCRKYPQRIRIRLGNTLSPTGNTKIPFFEKYIYIFGKVS